MDFNGRKRRLEAGDTRAFVEDNMAKVVVIQVAI